MGVLSVKDRRTIDSIDLGKSDNLATFVKYGIRNFCAVKLLQHSLQLEKHDKMIRAYELDFSKDTRCLMHNGFTGVITPIKSQRIYFPISMNERIRFLDIDYFNELEDNFLRKLLEKNLPVEEIRQMDLEFRAKEDVSHSLGVWSPESFSDRAYVKKALKYASKVFNAACDNFESRIGHDKNRPSYRLICYYRRKLQA